MRPKISKLPSRLITIVGGVFLLLLTLHLAGVALLRYFVERELHPALPQGTYIGQVHLNLLSGLLEIEDFQLRDEGQLRLRFANLLLDVSPWRLLTGRLHIDQARLTNGYLRVDRRADGSFDLGLPPFGDTAPPAAADQPAPFSLSAATLERVTVEYHDGDFASVLHADEMRVGAYSAQLDTQQVPVQWRLLWDGRGVAGDATITLDKGQLAATGEIRIEALDLGRVQQLARVATAVEGEVGLEGSFTWEVPRLSLRGRLEAPHLAYVIVERQVQLSGLRFPGFTLELVTAPALGVELSPGNGARVERVESRFGEHTLTARVLTVAGGTLRFADADRLELRDLDYRAERLDWQSAGRAASAVEVGLSGQLLQQLTGQDPFPSLHASLSATGLEYRDDAAATRLQLTALALDQATLSPSDDAGIRRLAGRVSAADGRLATADTTVTWSSIETDLSGALSDGAQRVAADLGLKGLAVAAAPFPGGPLQIEGFDATGLELGERTVLRRLRVQGMRLPAELDDTALQVAAVELTDGRYTPASGVGIGEIVIDGLQTGVVRDGEGVWRHVLSRSGPTAAGAAGPPGTVTDDGLAWEIGAFRITGDSRITVADSLNPDMQPLRYRVERLEVGALSSAAPNADTPFDIVLRPDAYSEFAIVGKVRPLADKLHLEAEGHLHGFGLTSTNGLVANDLGHRFVEGQLDNDFRISIAQDQLDMSNALSIAGVAVEELAGKEGPPLGTAIALLEDRDGNIKLAVPVAGNLADPQFRVLGALNPIIMKAVAGTAALAIQPFGSVLLVGGLLADQALKVTFEPALFEPGSTELNPAAQTYLGQLAAKLAEKPKLAVRVCGVVVDAERQRDKKGDYLDQEADLLAVAQQRADAARSYLARRGAGAKQLRACRPTLDPDQAGRPRVDIRF